jgi:hypothetical protein
LTTADEVSTYYDATTHPDEGLVCECGGHFMTAEEDFTDALDGFNVYWGEGVHDVPTEYAVYGWIKMNEAITDDEEQLVLRFATNEDDILGDADNLGDRTFLISVNKDNILLQSYTYDILYQSTSKSFYNTIPN